MLPRRWHRWIALPAGLFLMFITATGVLLHLDMMRLGQTPPGHGAPPTQQVQAMPSNAVLSAMIGRLADEARKDPKLAPESLQIVLTGPRITLVAGSGGPPGPPQAKFDAETGERIIDPPPPADFHYVLQDIHAGYFAGWPGRVISILCGLSLFVLAVTGLQVWWDMARRKKRPFWK